MSKRGREGAPGGGPGGGPGGSGTPAGGGPGGSRWVEVGLLQANRVQGWVVGLLGSITGRFPAPTWLSKSI